MGPWCETPGTRGRAADLPLFRGPVGSGAFDAITGDLDTLPNEKNSKKNSCGGFLASGTESRRSRQQEEGSRVEGKLCLEMAVIGGPTAGRIAGVAVRPTDFKSRGSAW